MLAISVDTFYDVVSNVSGEFFVIDEMADFQSLRARDQPGRFRCVETSWLKKNLNYSYELTL